MTETLLLLPLGTYRNGPCCASAASGTSTPSTLRQTLPSSAARLAAGRVVATSRVDLPDTNASGAHRCRHAPRIVIARLRREGMPRSPRARPPGSPVPRDPPLAGIQTDACVRRYGRNRGRSIQGCGSRWRLSERVAFTHAGNMAHHVYRGAARAG